MTPRERVSGQPDARSGRSSPAVPAGRRPGLPVGQPLDHRARAARARGRHLARQPGPTHDERRWTFDLDPGGVDPVLGIERLPEAYLNRVPDYPRGITVPAMVDVDTGQVVTNDFPQITHDLFFEWREHHRPDAPDLWPEDVPRGDGGGDEARLHRGQQRGLPLRLRRLAGGVRRGVRPAVGPRWTGSRSGWGTGAT